MSLPDVSVPKVDILHPVELDLDQLRGFLGEIAATDFRRFRPEEQAYLSEHNPLLQQSINSTFGNLLKVDTEKLAYQGLTGMLAAHRLLVKSAEPRLLPMIDLNAPERVTRQVFSAKYFKAPGDNPDGFMKPIIRATIDLFTSDYARGGAKSILLSFDDFIADVPMPSGSVQVS